MWPSFNVSLEARIRYKVFLFDLTGDLVHNLLHSKRACEPLITTIKTVVLLTNTIKSSMRSRAFNF